MWKTTITIVMATIGICAIVLGATAILIEASTVDPAATHAPAAPGRCHGKVAPAPLPGGFFLPANLSTARDRHQPSAD